MKSHYLIKSFFYCAALSMLVVALSCKSSETSAERAQKLNTLESKLNSKAFKIDVNTVYPFNTRATTQVLNQVTRYTGNTANQITVNGYDITFKNDSIIGELPYYGEQQLGGGRLNNQLGVVLRGIPKDYSLTRHKKKDAYIMKFVMDDNSDSVETYNVIMTFYINNMVNINILSSHRTTIDYRGQLKAIE
ncbi:DUF4251 domain-containing protein [Winogradskyella algicola]|uniref:DUF4251 domain-containing protein n=1 Tax=Winogradskyella algicola TaxID=2575815 RepID=UPI001108AE91|nr:DUF4251 domain-containing protein [Winogradskyella algicola]